MAVTSPLDAADAAWVEWHAEGQPDPVPPVCEACGGTRRVLVLSWVSVPEYRAGPHLIAVCPCLEAAA